MSVKRMINLSVKFPTRLHLLVNE